MRVKILKSFSGAGTKEYKPNDVVEIEGRNLEKLIKQGYCAECDAKGNVKRVLTDTREN